ncbi:phage head closure protein [Alteribacillus sp. YIM 98480]|uniref:phage head closure protein n=1 Tax=Alteribacillus sp. YIM 98480 TaxID=2606599 RepID=UPI00131E3E67|nr:phage head closure protein [Alteribacillus sp. YIM 98480]
MRPIRSGKLRQRILIQNEESVRQPGGTYETEWVTFLESWARVVPLSGTERYQAQQVQSKLSHRVEMRYREGVKPQMRVKYGDRIFEIEAVLNLNEMNREIHLMCSEVVT